MGRATTPEEEKYDLMYQQEKLNWVERIIIAIAKKQTKKIAKTAICRAFERRQIDSAGAHELAACVDRLLSGLGRPLNKI